MTFVHFVDHQHAPCFLSVPLLPSIKHHMAMHAQFLSYKNTLSFEL